MRSLTGTLFRGVTLGASLVLVAVGVVLFFSVRGYVFYQFDNSLLELAQMLALSVEEKSYGLEVDLEEMRIEEMQETKTPAYLQVGSTEGKVFYSSSALDDIPLLRDGEPVSEPVYRWERLSDGTRARSVRYTFTPEEDDEVEPEPPLEAEDVVVVKDAGRGDLVVLQLFRVSSEIDRFLNIFLVMLVLSGAGSLGVLALIMWGVIRKGAQPVTDLAAKIGQICDDDFTFRIKEESVLKELIPVAAGFNQVLERIGDSFSRERSFTSNAAHELRTPLAGLKTSIEVALTRERSEQEYREVLKKTLSIVNQMDNLVTGLLALIRFESGQEVPGRDSISLKGSIEKVLEGYCERIAEKGVDLSVNCSDGQTVVGDRVLFSRVVDELVKNAAYYVDRNGWIRIDSGGGAGRMRLSIANSGSQVNREDAEKVFDRFWRGNGGRGDAGARFGLGLPIVKKFVEAMGANIDVRSEIGGEFVVTLTLPGE